MRDIILHGELADKFIDKISLDVTSVPEAIAALQANFSGFYNYLLEYKPGFHIITGNIYRDNDTITLPLEVDDSINILPAIAGSGKIGMIVVGAFLIYITAGGASSLVAGWMGAGGAAGTAGAAAFAGTTAATVVSAIGSIGVGLVLSGISAILFSPPKTTSVESVENTPNTYFNGAVNTIQQGNPVSIGYGELIVGSAVISAGISIDTTSGYLSYPWIFTGSLTNNWTLVSTGVYYNTATKLYYYSTTDTYEYSKTITTNEPSISSYDDNGNEFYSRDIYGNIHTSLVTRLWKWKYTVATGMFSRVIPSCDTSAFIRNKDQYCVPSSTVPPEWAGG